MAPGAASTGALSITVAVPAQALQPETHDAWATSPQHESHFARRSDSLEPSLRDEAQAHGSGVAQQGAGAAQQTGAGAGQQTGAGAGQHVGAGAEQQLLREALRPRKRLNSPPRAEPVLQQPLSATTPLSQH